MLTVTVLLWVYALVAPGVLCGGVLEVQTACPAVNRSWGNNACSLGGSLTVKSVPSNLEVSSKNCNKFYNKSEFRKQPLVTLSDAKSDEKYTLVMVDPDAPGLPPDTYYLHWIVTNIVGEDFKKGNLKDASKITPYFGPTPPDGSGTHRYMLLAYSMRPGTRVAQPVEDAERSKFHLGEWTHKYNLCGPVSGVQYQTNFSGNPKP